MIQALVVPVDPFIVRFITSRYSDPLDTTWLSLATHFGLRIERDDRAFASSDGSGRLTIATQAALDADDCLAQMIFHEICHAIAQGDRAWTETDWGLAAEGKQSLLQEHTCLRLQHALAKRHGLELVLAPTTEHRAFYDALGEQSFGADESSDAARQALARASAPPFFPHVDRALERTAELARLVREIARDAGDDSSLLLARVRDAPDAGFDCHVCGACCREAFDVVELAANDPFTHHHPDLCVRHEGRIELRRPGGRCLGLANDRESYHCSVYTTRPETCRDFTRGSVNCREARLRVGLSTYEANDTP